MIITGPRPAVAEAKAALVLELHRLCHAIPPELGSASVQQTEAWTARIRIGRRVKGDTRASIPELQKTIEFLRRPVPCIGEFQQELEELREHFGLDQEEAESVT